MKLVVGPSCGDVGVADGKDTGSERGDKQTLWRRGRLPTIFMTSPEPDIDS